MNSKKKQRKKRKELLLASGVWPVNVTRLKRWIKGHPCGAKLQRTILRKEEE
jgi:hypothetical protein